MVICNKLENIFYESKPFLIEVICGPLIIWFSLYPLDNLYAQLIFISCAAIMICIGFIILFMRVRYRYSVHTHISRHGIVHKRKTRYKNRHQATYDDPWLNHWLDK